MKLLCLDSNSILNRAFYGVKPLTTSDGTFTNAIYGFMNILMKLLSEVSPDAVMFAFDLKAPTFRHKMYDGYKAQRKGMPEELAQQMPLIKELLTDLGYRIVTKEGYEADDILGTFARLCQEQGHQCYIATGDRDSLQLISESTTVLLATSKMGHPETIFCDEDYFFEKYGTEPKGLIDIKALMGDTSDNIPGVKGIGEKTALKLIGEYKTIDAIYEDVENIHATPSVRKKLMEGKENAYMSRTLATIDQSVPLDVTIEDCRPAPADEGKAFALLTRLEMNSMIKKLGLTDAGLTCEPVEEKSVPAPELSFVQELPLEGENVALMAQWKDGELLALAAADGHSVGMMNREQDGFEDTVKKALSLGKKLMVFDSKPFYRWAMDHGFSMEVAGEDCMLSAYLLSPNASEYTVDGLCSQYGVPVPVIKDTEQAEELCLHCARLIPLAQALRKEIAANGQEVLLDSIELPLARVLASMERDGLEVDTDALRHYGEGLDERIGEVQSIIYQQAEEEFNINSPKQLGEILFEKLGLPARRKTKTGYSTSAEVLESLEGKHEIIHNILEYRKLTKLRSTYVEGLLKVVDETSRIHSHFNQTDTRTGRLSSTEPNLQNIPVRTELGSQMRRFFRARDGWTLVDADYSQIELRVLAHIAKDQNMIDAFNSGEDIHTNTASQVFGLPPLFITPEMRRRAKAVNFGIVYGIGAFSLAQDIGVSVAQADEYIKQYLTTFSGVKQYMDDTIANGTELGYVSTLYGRRRYLPELNATNKNIVNFGKRVAMNTPIQGTAADIIKIAMVRVWDRLEREHLQSRLVLQVHDELIVETAPGEEEAVRALVKEEMESAAALSVPLTADVNCGKTWFDAK